MNYVARAVLIGAGLLFTTLAFADDWTAVKLRGTVVQLVDKKWQPLKRGDVVQDNRVIRTAANGVAEFTRGGETIDLKPDTQIQILDKHGVKPFTTVKQAFGTVAIEANVENVQHFAVQTPFLAAVVKGTKFVVTSGKSSSSVKVNRGHVLVEDNHDQSHVTLAVGQSASVDTEKVGAIVVTGFGQLPAVLDRNEVPIVAARPSTSSLLRSIPSVGQPGNGRGDDGGSNGRRSSDGNGIGSGDGGSMGNSGNGSGNGNSGNGGGDGGGNGNSGNGNGNGGDDGNGHGEGNGDGEGHGNGHGGGDD